MKEQYRKTFRELQVCYIWGKTGVGKTRGVMEQYGYENVYRVANYQHPFDSYAGQDVILFDEFRSSLQEKNGTYYMVLNTQVDGKRKLKWISARLAVKGRPSPWSLRLHKNILYQALTEAVKSGLLASNPCQYVVLPKSVRYESHFYTADQLNQFFRAICDEPLYPLLKITAIYGLRRSEVLGLKWDSIDFDAVTVTIRHTVSKVTKAVEKDKTKNATSYRSFPLTEEGRSIFQATQAAEKENRRLCGRQYQENDYGNSLYNI